VLQQLQQPQYSTLSRHDLIQRWVLVSQDRMDLQDALLDLFVVCGVDMGYKLMQLRLRRGALPEEPGLACIDILRTLNAHRAIHHRLNDCGVDAVGFSTKRLFLFFSVSSQAKLELLFVPMRSAKGGKLLKKKKHHHVVCGLWLLPKTRHKERGWLQQQKRNNNY
jgi:hypothetical protein